MKDLAAKSRLRPKPEYEIEKGLVKAQTAAAKTTAEMKAGLYAPGVEYVVTTAQIESTFKQDEGNAIRRQPNEWKRGKK